MNREQIKEILPHREPMLLVDEVFLNEDGSATGYYTVRGDEFFLQGHYPGNPIVPGVIQCEIMAQSAGIMFAEQMRDSNVVPLYTGLDKVRFKRPVKPGERIQIDTVLVKSFHPMYVLRGKLSVDGKICSSGEFSFVITTPE
jgi:3-hydroxyacyl-[acyl-carrier-protein] dehydratase